MVGEELTVPKVFGYQHLIYIAVFLVVTAVSVIVVRKKAHDGRFTEAVMRLTGGILVALLIWNRFSIAAFKGNQMLLIPDSFCGLCSLCFGLTALIGKRDNILLHYFVYLGIYGGAINTVYPDYLGQADSFLFPATISGMLHHSVSLYLGILMLVTGYIRPTVKKFYVFPLGMCVFLAYGLLLMDWLGFEKAMYIHQPLIENSVLTWYFVGLLIMVAQAVFLGTVELVRKRRSAKIPSAGER